MRMKKKQAHPPHIDLMSHDEHQLKLASSIGYAVSPHSRPLFQAAMVRFRPLLGL